MRAKLVKESLNEYMNDTSMMKSNYSSLQDLKSKLGLINPKLSEVQSWANAKFILDHENVLPLIKKASSIIGVDLIKDCYVWDSMSDERINSDAMEASNFFEPYNNKNLVEIAKVETDEYDDGGEDAQDIDTIEAGAYDEQDHFNPYSINMFYWDEENDLGVMICNPYYQARYQEICFIKK